MPVSFRQHVYDDIPWRVLDALLHGLAAFICVWRVPGNHWYYQWLPDALVPILWGYSWVKDRFLSQSNWLLVVHLRVLHNPLLPVGLGLLWLFVSPVFFALFVNIAVHHLIDLGTHENWKQPS